VADYTRELEAAVVAARKAGRIILGHYAAGGVAVEQKADASPVTAADRQANDAIVGLLRATFPGDAVLSEETPDDRARLGRSRVWIVDPLDGTRDFVARTGDFCVHVALVVDGVPEVGVVHHPVTDATFQAVRGRGAVVDAAGARAPLRVSGTTSPDDARIGISRLNVSAELRHALAATGLDRRAVPLGASVKLMAVARGTLDAVVSFTTAEREWDTCAPEVIVREAGGAYTDLDGRPLRYNQADTARRRGTLVSNGACHTAVLALLRPAFEAVHGPAPGGAS
jgi:3'(2'),5'-bisphosphate nucleotidase